MPESDFDTKAEIPPRAMGVTARKKRRLAKAPTG